MKFQPLHDKVVVKDVAVEKNKGKLLLPDDKKKHSNKGEVIAVGEGRVLENGQVVPLKLKVGDIVAYQEYGAIEVEHEDVIYKVMRETDVFCKIL